MSDRNTTNGRWAKRFCYVFSAVAAGFGFIALAGWILSVPWLTALWPGGIPMAPSTAVLFLTFGAALVLHLPDIKTFWSSRLPMILGWIGIGLSTLLFILSLCGIRLTTEHLGMSISGAVDGAPIGHMSPMTAFCFMLSGGAFLLFSAKRRPLLLTAFWLAGGIVLISIVLVVGYLVGAPLFYGTGVIPPALTTASAFLMLGIALLMAAGFRAWPHRTLGDASSDRLTAVLVLVFILLVTGILSAGYLFSSRQQKRFRAAVAVELSAIADLKVDQLLQWRRERIGDAALFYQNIVVSELVQRYLADPTDTKAMRRMRIWLSKIANLPQYVGVSLSSPSGRNYLTVPSGAPETIPRADIAKALQSRQIILTDFHRDRPGAPPHIDLVIPILSGPQWQTVLGVLVLRINPGQYLYPLLQRWPTPSRSAESLIIRRDGDAVLFLNNLRFYPDAALNLRIPLTRTDLPAAMAVQGQVGIVQGVDYRLAPVMAAIRTVPESPWFLVVRMDLDEINKPLHRQLSGTAEIVLSLLLGTGAIVGFIWRNQRARVYRMRYEASIAVEESEKKLRLIFESAKDGILIADIAAQTFVSANAAMCRMLGYTREELLAMRVQDIHPEADLPVVTEKFQKQASGEFSVAADIPMQRKDGSIFYADINTTPIHYGGRTCLLGTFRDITQRLQDEARIEHLNRVLRAIRNINQLIVRAESVDELIHSACTLLVEHQSYVSAVIILVDSDGRPTDHVEAGTGQSFQALIDQLEAGRLPKCCLAAGKTKGVCRILDPEDICSPCAMTGDCVSPQKMAIRLEHQQTVYGYLTVSVGTTIAMDAEEERLFDELAGDLAYSLHNMAIKQTMHRAEEENKQLSAQFHQAQKMEAVGQLAGGVAHDFNNLLSIIIGYSQLLAEETGTSETSRESLTEIYDAAIRAQNLTRQLLAFSRKQMLEMRIVSINQVITDFEKLIRRAIGEDIQVNLALTAESTPVKADVSQLEQILMNLAVNARDAMPDGGLLTIETARVVLDKSYAMRKPGVTSGPHVMIGISDNGCGMGVETQDKIFEPFFTTKPLGKGTGLGLATVYGVVKQHDGNIWVYSEPGQGTTFKIYLPVATETDSPKEATPETPKTSLLSETILVVEDEPALRRLACRILMQNNYTVLEAEDAQDAIDIAERHTEPIHLLLTDVVMPAMKGTEVFRKVSRFHPRIQVLYMSGYTENVIAHHGVLDDGVHFLQKPFSADGLLNKIADTLGQ